MQVTITILYIYTRLYSPGAHVAPGATMPLARADELRSQAALEEAALALHMALGRQDPSLELQLLEAFRLVFRLKSRISLPLRAGMSCRIWSFGHLAAGF